MIKSEMRMELLDCEEQLVCGVETPVKCIDGSCRTFKDSARRLSCTHVDGMVVSSNDHYGSMSSSSSCNFPSSKQRHVELYYFLAM